MKKMLSTALMVMLASLGIWATSDDERHYVNLSFIVWKLENGPTEAAIRINTPIPEVLNESWICDILSFDVTEGKPVSKIEEKDGLRFVLTAEPNIKLTSRFMKEKKNCSDSFTIDPPPSTPFSTALTAGHT